MDASRLTDEVPDRKRERTLTGSEMDARVFASI
jgi:hypothetical protein